MFTLKIHTNSFPECITTVIPTDDDAGGYKNLCAHKLRGVAHLFEDLPSALQIFVPAMPNVFSPKDFLRFCESYVPKFSEICFIRNGEEDRYSVLITLKDQCSADEFYRKFNGKNFMDSEDEVCLCHLFFIRSAKYTRSTEPLPGFHELPTCPVCLERLGYNTSGQRSTLCDHSFLCSCVSKWTNLSCLACQLCQRQDKELACVVCETLVDPRVCLICGIVACGSNAKGHASNHWDDKQHRFALEVGGKKIWDYYGDVYVSRPNQPEDGSSDCNSVEIVDEYTRRLASEFGMLKARNQELMKELERILSANNDLIGALRRVKEEKNVVDSMNEELRKTNEELMKRNEELMTRQDGLKDLNTRILHKERETKEKNDKKMKELQAEIMCVRIQFEEERETKEEYEKKIKELQDEITAVREQVKGEWGW